MIVTMRIDDRLLHGQVVYSWKAALSYHAVVIASDEVSRDETRKTALKMSCPEGVRLAIRSIEEAAKLLKNPKLDQMKVFVICQNPKDAYDLLQLIDERPIINVGGMQNADGKAQLSPAVYVSQEDIEYLDHIQESGITIEVRQVPTDNVRNYDALKSKLKF